jgi:hypothetical protein
MSLFDKIAAGEFDDELAALSLLLADRRRARLRKLKLQLQNDELEWLWKGAAE